MEPVVRKSTLELLKVVGQLLEEIEDKDKQEEIVEEIVESDIEDEELIKPLVDIILSTGMISENMTQSDKNDLLDLIRRGLNANISLRNILDKECDKLGLSDIERAIYFADKIERLSQLVFNKAVKLFINPVESKINITFDEIKNELNKVDSSTLQNTDVIVCITRGGLIPAGLLSYKLNVKNVINLKIESYNNQEKGAIVINKLSKKDIKLLKKSKNILIVDDIIDTGETMEKAYEYIYELLYSSEKVDEYGDLKETSIETFAIVNKQHWDTFSLFNLIGDKRWVVFPWDNEV